ncbi:MAG TPA: hypothetical protein VGM30_10330 [Puia sp.]|jgi:hypothetical protein
MSNVYIRPGFWVRTVEAVKGALDIRAVVREILTAINVPYSDSCCTPDVNTQPVRFNASSSSAEHFNGTSWVAFATGGSVGPGTVGGVVPQAMMFDSLTANINAKAQFQDAPAAANSPGSPGQIAFDAAYFYLCVATDTWMRVAMASW